MNAAREHMIEKFEVLPHWGFGQDYRIERIDRIRHSTF
jgi:hypothetical protein